MPSCQFSYLMNKLFFLALLRFLTRLTAGRQTEFGLKVHQGLNAKIKKTKNMKFIDLNQ